MHAQSLQSKTGALAVVAHVYYPEVLPEVLDCWRNLVNADKSTPLHITTVTTEVRHVRTAIGNLPNIYVHVGPNRGRDIAPFLRLLNEGVLDPYDAVLKIHTKKSPHLRAGNLRRRLLFTLLAGNHRQIESIRKLFNNPRVGMVGWHLSFRNRKGWWMANEVRAREMVERMTPRPDVQIGFFQGSMFWVRPMALEALRSLNLQLVDFEPEKGQLDGTLHHAVERMFALSVWAGGYTVNAISGRVLDAGR